jgi:hypothetical protein
MNPENDHQFQHLCANAHQTQNKIFIHNMLASLNADDFEEKINSENIQSISELFGVILNTYNLIQMGIFPPVTNKILQVFSRAKSANRENNEEQMNFSLAVALGKGDLLNKKLFPDDFLNHNGNHIASEWITEVKKKAELQFTLLHKISNEVIDEKFIEDNKQYFKYHGGDMELLFMKCKVAHSKNLIRGKNDNKSVLNKKNFTLNLFKKLL